MSAIPIVRRELQVASRRPATYYQRLAATAIALSVVVLASFARSTAGGSDTFQILSAGGFILCIFEGLRTAADALARERREGTLGLLFLTNLRPYQVVLGKLSSVLVRSFPILLAILPIFALPLLLGGVTWGETSRVMFTLIVTLIYAACAGLFASSIASSTLGALAAALFILGSLGALERIPTMLADAAPAGWGPLGMLITSYGSGYDALSYWMAFGWTAIVCPLMLAAAGYFAGKRSLLLPRTDSRAWWYRFIKPQPGYTETWESADGQSPGVWLAERTLPGRRLLHVLIGCGALACFATAIGGKRTSDLVIPLMLCFGFMMKLWIAVIAPQSLSEARRSGALELLLCTPLRPAQIVAGQRDALRAYFMAPALAIAFAFPLAALIGHFTIGDAAEAKSIGSALGAGLGWILLFFLDLHALIHAGLWFGLSSPQLETAIGRTAFCVLILPLLSLFVPLLGCLAFLLVPAFVISWASRRLNERFREQVARQFSTQEDEGWLLGLLRK